MEFLNYPIDVDFLPKAEETPLQRVEKDYLKVLRIEWLITIGILLIGILALVFFTPWLSNVFGVALAILGWIMFALVYFLLQTKAFSTKAYAVRDRDIIYRSGWIIQRTRTSPFNRIQHSSISSSFFERKFGLATLVLFCAGTDDADLRIPGLKETDANNIKEWITQKIVNEQQPAT